MFKISKKTIFLNYQAFGVYDERMGEELAAWIKLNTGSSLDSQDIKAFCKGKVSRKAVNTRD